MASTIADIGMSQLKKAFKKGMAFGVKDVTFEKDKLCSACQAGKQVASHHPMKAYVSTTRPLELRAHSHGPLRTNYIQESWW